MPDCGGGVEKLAVLSTAPAYDAVEGNGLTLNELSVSVVRLMKSRLEAGLLM